MPNPQQSPSRNSSNFTPGGVNQTAGIAPQQQYIPGTDPSANRLGTLSEGLAKGGSLALEAVQEGLNGIFNFFKSDGEASVLDVRNDWRLRVSMQPQTAALFYANPNNPLMFPLIPTSGVIFPYTPTLDIQHKADYKPQELTHSNYQSYFYDKSSVEAINISADFTVQTEQEGQYMIAAMHFFKSCTKMFYGNSQLAGTPPPMVFLDGYGVAMLPHVPCVVTNFGYVLPGDVDYVDVRVGVKLEDTSGNPIQTNNYGPPTRVPTSSQLRITLQPVYSRTSVARRFTLENYSNGYLLEDSYSSRGGFL
jgi:hypothetical protein